MYSDVMIVICIVINILKERVLGWDSEWFAPIISPSYPHLLQISGEKRVWIIDGIWLKNEKTGEANSILSVLTNFRSIFHVFKGGEDVNLLKK